MSSTATGNKAEAAASDYLKRKGYKILIQNWRTRYCEIDIIAQKHKTIFFVEVKYRKSAAQGNGLDYITPKKLEQMSFAAEVWVSQNNWEGEYTLAAIAVSGENFTITDVIFDF